MKLFLCLTLSIIILSCGKVEDPNFKYFPLESLKYEAVRIDDGTTIQILSYSGGPVCTPNTTYYFQFIGINKNTNDTVRILSPCQSLAFDTMPEEGSFFAWQDQAEKLDKILKENGHNVHDAAEELVVFNKAQFEIEKRNYKTTIGNLGFK